MSDIWEGMYPYILDVYRNNKNFRIIDTGNNKNICVIFFSGNGIYFPNSYFKEKIIENDRYEWENISKSIIIRKKAGRLVFLRDVWKQFYITGINANCNTVEKTLDLLKQLTAGYEVITVGNSAGGYAAVLFGCLLNAKSIFSISGQFFVPARDLLKENINNSFQYYDLNSLVSKYSGTIIYIFPCRAWQDVPQNNHVEGLDNIVRVRVVSDIHGEGLLPENYQYIFFYEVKKIKSKIDEMKEYYPIDILVLTSPWYFKFKEKLSYCLKKTLKQILIKLGLFYFVKKQYYYWRGLGVDG